MSAAVESSVLVDTAEANDDVWASIARGYAAFGTPLVPCCEDIHLYESAVHAQAEAIQPRGIDALMLGVTPGIALMKWPAGARITAVEQSSAVIGALWPGDIPGIRQAHCASWFEMPKAHKSCDVVLGDGSLNACRFPSDVWTLCRSLHERLRGGGILVVRCYTQPDVQENIDAVFEACFSATGLKVDCFKLRLFTAMQRSVEQGVAVRDAARILDRYHLDNRTMEHRLSWNKAAIEPFAKWRGSDAIYFFPKLHELRAVLAEWFDEVSVTWPDYELGHCCPMLVMRSREGTTSTSR